MTFTEDLFSLDGKVAAVVGAGGVLAGEMAQGFAAAGARIAVIDLNREHAEARAASIREAGGQAVAVTADATSKVDLQRALAETLAAYGRVDILLNAAGINSGTPFFEITEEEWHRILDVDLKSVFLACQVFGKHMVEAGAGGSIINISSASSGPPLSKVFTYGVAKAGINQITQFLARELAPHNDTSQRHPAGLLSRPSRIANSSPRNASPASSATRRWRASAKRANWWVRPSIWRRTKRRDS